MRMESHVRFKFDENVMYFVFARIKSNLTSDAVFTLRGHISRSHDSKKAQTQNAPKAP